MPCLGLVSPEARGQVNLRVRFEGGVLLAKRPYVGQAGPRERLERIKLGQTRAVDDEHLGVVDVAQCLPRHLLEQTLCIYMYIYMYVCIYIYIYVMYIYIYT